LYRKPREHPAIGVYMLSVGHFIAEKSTDEQEIYVVIVFYFRPKHKKILPAYKKTENKWMLSKSIHL
jgi:hypothetical protein